MASTLKLAVRPPALMVRLVGRDAVAATRRRVYFPASGVSSRKVSGFGAAMEAPDADEAGTVAWIEGETLSRTTRSVW